MPSIRSPASRSMSFRRRAAGRRVSISVYLSKASSLPAKAFCGRLRRRASKIRALRGSF